MHTFLCLILGHKFQSFNPMPGNWTNGFCRRCGCILQRGQG